ncbi:MAG: UvrD-helicase domain-containing protein, partial [Candidatus Izemoplasmatales bacterium]|nr:UvrD-helicase domain-containing protein [Candidatus Izemoplasmatales bacterium]
MIEYTDNQILAKNYEGKNILVSASAGSGKTGVLKERVIRKINDKVDIDKLIILTFTEAAAYEMKSRIIKEIHKNELFDQIPKLDNAIISTFDAFCLRLVKEYHYLLDVENTITIADSVLIKSKKQVVIKEILKRYYEENSKQFNQTFKRYFSKSDAWLYNAVYRLGEDFRKNPSYQEILENYHKAYLTEEFIEDKANEYLDSLLNEIKAEYEIFANDFLKNLALSDEVYSSYISEANLIINDLLNSSQDEFIKKLSAISFPRKKGPKELPKPPIIEKIQKLAKEVNELFAIDLLTLKDSFYSSQEAVNVLLEITAKYLSEFEVVKKEENLYSFEDIMFLAIQLFEDNPKIAKKYQDNINEILIDEYQDTNDLQDRFIALISNNNTFMVGDIKQSIYRFRNANPKNFLRIYEDYLSSDNGKAIFLQENFRSNGFVLEEINKVFKKLMTKNRGGIDYKDQQILKTGYKKNHPVHDKNALEIKLYDLTDLEDDEEEVSKAQAEAHIIAKDIKKRIENKELIYDLKAKSFRELNYQDITILAAQKSDFNTYAKIISDYNIPLDVYNDEPFFSSEEILFVFQYLLLINSFIDEDYFKKYFKSAFYSVARSFVYKIKDQVLSRFFAFEKIDSIADLTKLTDYEELKVIYEDILSITAKCWDLPPSVILEEVYDKLHIYRKIADLKNPGEKEEKLDFFLLKLESFSFFTFSDLIKYLELIIETNEFDIEYSKDKKSVNAIKIMSMHKAKGLEFSICYLTGLYKRFQNPDKREPFIFSKEYGILTKAYNDGFYENFLRKLYFRKDDEEDLSERIRLLYVA